MPRAGILGSTLQLGVAVQEWLRGLGGPVRASEASSHRASIAKPG